METTSIGKGSWIEVTMTGLSRMMAVSIVMLVLVGVAGVIIVSLRGMVSLVLPLVDTMMDEEVDQVSLFSFTAD